MLQAEELRMLSQARLDHAQQCLQSAKALLSCSDYRGAANRSYYAVFHAMRAVLALDGIDMKHHSGIISEFRRLYIKTGKLDEQLSDIIQEQSETRTSSDYDDFFVLSNHEVEEQIAGAEKFLGAISAFLQS